ncbi:hypothetical protein Dimus_011469 [Dionaea muscipula]
MDILSQSSPPSTLFIRKIKTHSYIINSSSGSHPKSNTTICFSFDKHIIKKRSSYPVNTWVLVHDRQLPLLLVQKKKPLASVDEDLLQEENPVDDETDQKGTVLGAVALIIGTSIGSGILALPKKISAAGFVPSSISLMICWGFLLVEALLVVEINVGLLNCRKKKKRNKVGDDDEKESGKLVISMRSMAQETLGECGGVLATVTYVFLGYSSMVAYCAKSGDILFHLINYLPASISGCFFTAIFTALIALGGVRSTDQVNQWLTTCMIGLLVMIEVLAALFGGWPGFDLQGYGDWGQVPVSIPVMIFSLVYHDLLPVVCAYLGGDAARIRASLVLGSVVPLIAILIWDGIVLGLSGSAETSQVSDPVELLASVRWGSVSYMVETFSLLAVGTSIIGTLLGFSEFFKEQLAINHRHSPETGSPQLWTQQDLLNSQLRKWWMKNRIGFGATALVILPTFLLSTTIPDAFSTATNIAGGYCMAMLYGVLPPAMALAMNKGMCDHTDHKAMTKARPALLGVGLLASGIVAQQIFQDFSGFHH